LFSVACCRRVWDRLDEESQKAVLVAERYADGQASEEERNGAHISVWVVSLTSFPIINASAAAKFTSDKDLSAKRAAHHAREASSWSTEKAEQTHLLRDILGPLPFRPVIVDPSWLNWNGGTVVRLAQSIYDDRAIDRLPVLGDALEEAGCQDPDILAHCRSGGDHIRGCWPVDLILGKS
jgi:hypothetical protein